MSRLSGDAVIVLGMHRSGTSGLTNALSCLGLYLGKSEDLLLATPQNTGGHFELTALLYLNERLLWYLGHAYNRVKPFPAGWASFPRIQTFLGEANGILENSFSNKPLWGWKEPRTCMLVPFYLGALARSRAKPHFVICARNPIDVMSSLAKREGYEPNHSLGLWLRYTLCALNDTLGASRTVVVYESLLNEPRAALEPATSLVSGWQPDEASWQAAIDAVRPTLSHHRADQKALDDRPKIAQETFKLCLECANDPGVFLAGGFDDRIRALYGEMALWIDLFVDPPTDGDLVVRYQSQGQPDMERRIFRPTPDWREFRIPLSPDPGSVVVISFVNAVCSLLIRRVEWLRNGSPIQTMTMAGHDARLIPGAQRQLVVVGGPEQLLVKAPDQDGEVELVLDFSLETSTDMPIRIGTTLLEEIDQLRRQMGHR